MVGLLGLMSLQLVAIRGNASSRSFSTAVAIAQEKLETVEFLPFGNLSTAAEVNATNVSPWNASGFTTQFTRNTTVTTVVAATGVPITTVLVDVSWPDQTIVGFNHHVKMWTAVTQ